MTSLLVTIDPHARVMRSGRTGRRERTDRRVKIGHRMTIGRGGRIGPWVTIDHAAMGRRRSGVPGSTAAMPGVRGDPMCPMPIAVSAVDRFVSRASKRQTFSSRARTSSQVAGRSRKPLRQDARRYDS